MLGCAANQAAVDNKPHTVGNCILDSKSTQVDAAVPSCSRRCPASPSPFLGLFMVAATEPAARDPEAVVDHLNNAHVVVLFFCRSVQATSLMPRSLSCTLS